MTSTTCITIPNKAVSFVWNNSLTRGVPEYTHLSEEQPDGELDRSLLEDVAISNLALKLLLAPLGDERTLVGIKPSASNNLANDVTSTLR